MKSLKITAFFFATFVFLAFFKSDVKANDGTFKLRSTTGQSTRCYASSLLMQDNVYTILVSCRDLIYPADSNIINYVLWAQPADGSSPVSLGTLGYGKKTVRTGKKFNSMFVTIEQRPGNKPTGKVVMQGNIEPVTFLENPGPVTPTSEQQQQEGETGVTPTPTPTEQLSTRDKLFQALRRAGIAALIALVALIGLIFVVTRSRG